MVTLPPASYTKRRSVNQNNLPLVIYEVTQTCCDEITPIEAFKTMHINRIIYFKKAQFNLIDTVFKGSSIIGCLKMFILMNLPSFWFLEKHSLKN